MDCFSGRRFPLIYCRSKLETKIPASFRKAAFQNNDRNLSKTFDGAASDRSEPLCVKHTFVETGQATVTDIQSTTIMMSQGQYQTGNKAEIFLTRHNV